MLTSIQLHRSFSVTSCPFMTPMRRRSLRSSLSACQRPPRRTPSSRKLRKVGWNGPGKTRFVWNADLNSKQSRLILHIQPYIVGREPGQKVRFNFHTAIGDVKLFYQRSTSYGLGKVDCWVDDNVQAKVKLDGWWERPQSIPESSPIATNLSPGAHVLTCEVIEETRDPGGGHEFRITTVVA